MRLPRIILSVALAMSLVACRSAQGPQAALGAGTATALDAADEVAARQTIAAFVDSYAHEPRSGTALIELSAPAWLQDWARWVLAERFAQAVAFDGTISGDPIISSISGPLQTRPNVDTALIGVDAKADFTFTPTAAEPQHEVRSFLGPAAISRAADGTWQVEDITLDGIQLHLVHQLAVSSDWIKAGPLGSVRLVSADLGKDWRFNLVLGQLDRRAGVADVALIASDGSVRATPSQVHLVPISRDQGGLIVSFPPLTDLQHTRLRIALGLHGRTYPVSLPVNGFHPPPATAPG
jgi:hypothetical protein